MSNCILAIITARGGSKGLPRKNIRFLKGKPLIVHTIERALAVGDPLYKILVSTDDPEIADISRKANAYVPFLRPQELSTDTATSLEVVQHAVRYIEEKDGLKIDWSLILQPTTPLRTTNDIRSALELISHKQVDTVVSVYEAGNSHPGKMKCINENGMLETFLPNVPWLSRRQDRKPSAFLTNGGIYMTRRDVLFDKNSLIGDYILPYIMPHERSVDIDTEIEFTLAEILFARQINCNSSQNN